MRQIARLRRGRRGRRGRRAVAARSSRSLRGRRVISAVVGRGFRSPPPRLHPFGVARPRLGGFELPPPAGRGLSHCRVALVLYLCFAITPPITVRFVGLPSVSCGGFLRPSPLPPSKVGGAGSCGCPCRAPAAGAAAAPEGTPLRRLRFAGTAVAYGGFLSAGAVFCVSGAQGFPLVASAPRFAPCAPAPSARVAHTFFVSRGARGSRVSCSGLTPLRPSRGACLQPPCTP